VAFSNCWSVGERCLALMTIMLLPLVSRFLHLHLDVCDRLCRLLQKPKMSDEQQIEAFDSTCLIQGGCAEVKIFIINSKVSGRSSDSAHPGTSHIFFSLNRTT